MLLNTSLAEIAYVSPFEVQEISSRQSNSENRERGAIYTKREVVEFILDLIGYIPRPGLESEQLLEPSFGEGDFLIPAVERLL